MQLAKQRCIISTFICILFLLIVAYLFISLYKILTTTAPDFQVFYGAAKDIVLDQNPYTDASLFTAYNYPPITVLLYLPFLMLPLPYAQGVFVIVSTLAGFGSVYLALKITMHKISFTVFALVSSLTFLAFPVKFTLGMGQTNLIALFLLLLSFYYFQKSVSKPAGIFLALCILFKPILCTMLLFFLFRREWKIVKVTLISILIAFFFSLLLITPDTYVYYVTQHFPQLTKDSGLGIYYNQSFAGFLARQLEDAKLQKILHLVFAISMIVAITIYSIKKKADEKLVFSLFLIALSLTNLISWQHHFVLLLFPFLVTSVSIYKSKHFLLLIPLALSYLLVAMNIKDPSTFTDFGVFLLSHGFYGAIILLGVTFLLLRKKRTI